MADEKYKPKVVPLSGKLITAVDPLEVGENFVSLKNMRYTDTHPKGVGGMTKINTSAPSTYIKHRNAHHFRKQQPVESHILTQSYNTGLSASQVLDNTTTPPSQGNFSATALWTDGTGAGRGRFSDAPGGNTAYGNGVEACIWGGNEIRCSRFINFDSEGTFSYDYTDQITNTLTDSLNVATLRSTSSGNDSSTKLLLPMNGTDASTSFPDSSASAHTVTAVGNAQIDTAQQKFGTASGLFDGTGDYLTVPDHADFDLSGGIWSIDCWVSAAVSGWKYIYYHATDANNFMRIGVNVGALSLQARLEIYSGGIAVVDLTSGAYTPGTPSVFQHIEVTENGNNYYIFVDGFLMGQVVDTSRAANYTGSVYIGGDALSTDHWNGWLDEYRVSNGAARHTEAFSTQSVAYENAVTYCYLGSTRPLKGFKVYVGTANTNTNTMSVEYWSGSAWVAVSSLSDGTASGGKSLAATGSVTFTSTASTAKVKAIDKVVLYWYRITLNRSVSSGTTISYITLDAPFQTVKDIWDGEMRKVLSFQQFADGTFNDNTVNVFQDTYDSANTATFSELDSLTTSTEYLVAGFDEQMMGIELKLIGGHFNTTASTIMTVKYWNGTAWTALAAEDGTSEDSKSLSKSGVVTWNPPSLVTEFKREINKGLPLYYYRIEFSVTLSSDVQLFYVGGIPAQKTILGYKFPLFADNRLYWFGELAKDKNKWICTATHAADVYNGEDAGEDLIGNETEFTAAAWIYNRIGSDLRSIKLITKANETWILEGTGPTTWRQYQLSDHIGCIAPLTMRTTTLGVGEGAIQIAIWQGARGLYLSSGEYPIPIHWDIRDRFDDRSSNLINASYAHLSYGFIDHEKMEYHWLYASSASTGSLDKEMVYDILRKKWYEVSRGTGKELQCGVSVKDANGNNYNYGAIDTGYLERLEYGNDFDGTAIAHEFQTGDFTLAGMLNETTIRKVRLIQVAKSTTTNEATLTHYGDSATSGAALDTFDPTASGKRLSNVIKGTNLRKHVFHSFKGTMSTSDESCGFEPIAIAMMYRDEGQDLN